jgi:hypothetical protein
MLTTRFTQLIGCSVPIQQTPIGGLANADLVAARKAYFKMVTVFVSPPSCSVAMRTK